MRRMWRWKLVENKIDADGRHAIGFGLKFGYWPCHGGPYLQWAFLFWHGQFWYGLPSMEQVQRDDA